MCEKNPKRFRSFSSDATLCLNKTKSACLIEFESPN